MVLPVLSVIGLGKLGAPFAAVMAARGFRVIGVDKRPAFVRAINKGKAPVSEPRLQECITRGAKRLSATADIAEAVKASTITFIVVPTPSGKDDTFSNATVLEALKQIARTIREKKERHVIVVTSTVMPGSSDGVFRETIETLSGKIVGQNVGYCYNPEFIALGSVIDDMLNPDFILIGESDRRAGAAVAAIYKKACGKNTLIRRMAPVNAEIAKLAVNTYVTTKISYANMLAGLCEALPQGDVDVVTQAVGSDSRIGIKYLKGASAYGGPCFPRDNLALSALAKKLGVRSDIARATHALNMYQPERLLKKITALVPRGSVIGIAGMAYKPGTHVIERSAGMALAEALLKAGYDVIITDPLAARDARKALKDRVAIASDIRRCAQRSDALVVMTPLAAYAGNHARALLKRRRPLTVFDCWRMYGPQAWGKKATIISLGRHILKKDT